MDYTIRIGGAAGQGLQTIGAVLARSFCRQRFYVFTHQDYMSRVRGGHNFYQIRISDKPVTASRESVDILVALDKNTLALHGPDVHDSGVILCEPAIAGEVLRQDSLLAVPFTEIALREGGNRIMAGSVAMGAVLGLLSPETEIVAEILTSFLKKKSLGVIEGNLKALRAGHGYSREHCRNREQFLVAAPGPEKLMLINGVQAIGFGALLSGCKFYSAYPMTPATGIMTWLAGKAAEQGMVVEQAEDEISAINMALGASYAGVRAMTGTSGGGYALMTEGVSLAGMTETPLVIAEMQRPGPATGLPTRTEQSDLLFVIYGGHGEFPRVVFAPGTPEQAFFATGKAFDLAEKYQIPVFILGDQYLGDCEWTLPAFDLSQVRFHDYRLRGQALRDLPEYRRYAFTEDGVSPLAVPGDSHHLVVVDSDEHDEDGHMIEDGETRIRMVQKRLHRKLENLRREIAPPALYGDPQPEIVLVGYGSTFGVLREAIDALAGNCRIAMLHFSEVWPFPGSDRFDYLGLLRQAQTTICVELNATGQFDRLLRAETGFCCGRKINRYDGRPFTRESLLASLEQHLNPVAPGV